MTDGVRKNIKQILGFGVVVFIFFYLTINGQEIPDWVQWLMILGAGSFMVGVDKIMDYFNGRGGRNG